MMAMEETAAASRPGRTAYGRVRRRTLALTRWIGVIGQFVTIAVVHAILDFDLPLLPALTAVAAFAISNLGLTFHFPARARLTDREAVVYLGFDIVQLSALLFLTGGLHNPFALLILVPMSIAATLLSRWSIIALGLLSVLCITVLGQWHLPLPWGGEAFALPRLYVFAVWLGLVLATILLAAYNWSLAEAARNMSSALSETQIALAREQQLSALGMLAAAAAHELGSPLGTVAVVAKEIARDLPEDSPLAEDIALLSSQTQRCREILAALAQHPEQVGAPVYGRVPVTLMVESAVPREAEEKVAISFESGPAQGAAGSPTPMVSHSPEILHGLRSLIQNAAQFARTEVAVATSWDAREVAVTIRDDGPGFSRTVLQLLGEPYISSRAGQEGHMGLGVFIAQTLLERTGAMLSFANQDHGGAAVTVRWPRGVLESIEGEQRRETSRGQSAKTADPQAPPAAPA